MVNILLLVICFLLGILFRRWETFPLETPRVLNAFIIYISLPALILLYIPQLEIEISLLALVLMPWILFGFSFLFMNFIGKYLNFDKPLIGSLILTSGLGNTSFVGLPMIEAYYGKELVKYGILVDQAGTFFTLSSLGLITALQYSRKEKIKTIEILKRIFTFPPFMVLILSFLLKFFYELEMWKAFQYKEEFYLLLKKLGDTLPPMALFSVGFQLRISDYKNYKLPLMIGLIFKLLLAPFFISFIYHPFELKKEIYNISVFEAAMGPMITGGIVAVTYNLHPPFVSLMLAAGISLSFLTLPVFWYFFH